MEVDHFTNGVTESSSNGFLNGTSKHTTEPDDCDADMGEQSVWRHKKLDLRLWMLRYSSSSFFLAAFFFFKMSCTHCACHAALKTLFFSFWIDSTEVESAQSKRQLCGGSQAAIERMIHFGRELQSMSEHLRRECGKNSANKKMLKVTQESLSYLLGLYCLFLWGLFTFCVCISGIYSWLQSFKPFSSHKDMPAFILYIYKSFRCYLFVLAPSKMPKWARFKSKAVYRVLIF